MVFDGVNREANLTCNYLATPVYPTKGFAIKQDREIILVALIRVFKFTIVHLLRGMQLPIGLNNLC